MIRRALLGVLFASCALSAEDATPWKGRYKLSISNDAAWHNDAVELETVSVEEMEGMLEVEEPEVVEPPHAPAHTVAGGKAGLDLAPDMVEDDRTRPA